MRLGFSVFSTFNTLNRICGENRSGRLITRSRGKLRGFFFCCILFCAGTLDRNSGNYSRDLFFFFWLHFVQVNPGLEFSKLLKGYVHFLLHFVQEPWIGILETTQVFKF